MTKKMNCLRRFLCLRRTATSPVHPTAAAAATYNYPKRISTSLRDDIIDEPPRLSKVHYGAAPAALPEDESEPPTPTAAVSQPYVPPRASKAMVIGTIFGLRRGGHVWFCVQHDRLNTKPSLLLELSISTTALIQEMKCGLVRIALEFKDESPESELSRCPLHSVPMWTLFCNGKKLGFAVRRRANRHNRLMLRTMQSITVGAGVIPAGFGSDPGASEELMYMRAHYECVVGNADSESFHLINPDEGQGQELSIFLLRSR